MKSSIMILAAALAMAAAGCGQNSPVNSDMLGSLVGGQAGHAIKAGGHLANAQALSEKDEETLGQSVGVALTSRYGVYNDPNVLKYVTMVGLTVASSSPSPNGNYVFGVLNSEEVNAFSGPNGYIFITHGLLTRLKDEAELAGVLGHEISHVCSHDGLHQVQSAETSKAAAEAISAASNQAAQYSLVVGQAVDVLTKQSYTQPQEYDADKHAVAIMAAAGYDPRSYLNFLQRLQKEVGSAAGGQLMSTHPGVASRVGRVTEQVKSIKPGGATLARRFEMAVAK